MENGMNMASTTILCHSCHSCSKIQVHQEAQLVHLQRSARHLHHFRRSPAPVLRQGVDQDVVGGDGILTPELSLWKSLKSWNSMGNHPTTCWFEWEKCGKSSK